MVSMNIRIDFKTDGSSTIIHVAGWLSGTTVVQLEKACDPVEDPAAIDLSNLLFADDDGITAIRAIADRGAEVCGASPFLQLLIDHASGTEPDGEKS